MSDHGLTDGRVAGDSGEAVARLVRSSGRRPAIDAEREARVRAAVEQRWRENTTRKSNVVRFPMRRVMMAAAALVVLGLAAVMWRWTMPGVSGESVQVATVELIHGEAQWQKSASRDLETIALGQELGAESVVQTGGDGRLAFQLATGHSMRVDGNSRVQLTSADRVELLSGAVYLDSGGSDGRAVVVGTSFAEVFEIGTQFEVRLDGDQLKIRVREGRVMVHGDDERHEVVAGRQLVRDTDGKVEVVDSLRFGPSWSWIGETTPPFPLDGRQLGDYLEWLSRESGREIRFEPVELEDAVRKIRLHGELPAMQPDLTPELVLPTCGLSAERRNDVLFVTREPQGS